MPNLSTGGICEGYNPLNFREFPDPNPDDPEADLDCD